ncbi:MAG: hypothetical protein FWG87_04755 [Defluviitaleaceae bacterium]|nr:hypothetical protein [Defluviitaleaceae bacterium]
MLGRVSTIRKYRFAWQIFANQGGVSRRVLAVRKRKPDDEWRKADRKDVFSLVEIRPI